MSGMVQACTSAVSEVFVGVVPVILSQDSEPIMAYFLAEDLQLLTTELFVHGPVLAM